MPNVLPTSKTIQDYMFKPTPTSIPISEQPQEQEVHIIDSANESTSTVLSQSFDTNEDKVMQKNSNTFDTTSEVSCSKNKKNRRKEIYLPQWEKEPSAFYRTMILDPDGEMQVSRICWLQKKEDGNGNVTIGCRLCNRYRMIKNANGKVNKWATSEYTVLSLDKIKEHAIKNERHIEAQQLELDCKMKIQPDWQTTQSNSVSKHQESIQNLMFTAICICQQDHPLNSFEPWCNLQEKNGVTLLPAEVSGVSYRNDNAALCFLQHIGHVLHEELLEKIKESPVIGWMLDESTSRTCQKSCIVYVRYTDNYEQKTAFYGLMNMEGNGTAQHIVEKLTELWNNDDVIVRKTCWLASDNASTFTGINNGVAAKLRRIYGIDYLELNTCAAHTYALVGNQAGKEVLENGTVQVREDIAKFESKVGRIYTYFSRSSVRQSKLKKWQSFLDLPELKFKRLFDIRWCSIRDCLKPIIVNIEPGQQALFATLEQISDDEDLSTVDRENALDLYNAVLDDSFLFYVHFHHDLQECVSGELTKLMQDDDISYTSLMDKVQEKKIVLNGWLSTLCPSTAQKSTDDNSHSFFSTSTYVWGPSLAKYIQLTSQNSFGAFLLDTKDRQTAVVNCRYYIERFLSELDRRFPPSKLQESLCSLFDPVCLLKNKEAARLIGYGREHIDYISKKYKRLNNFDSNKAASEWESLRPSLVSFTVGEARNYPRRLFWQHFVLLQQAICTTFVDDYKNILLLTNVYLASPTNSAECERGYSAANRIQTNGRSRLMIDTLNYLLTVRLLMADDIRRYNYEDTT